MSDDDDDDDLGFEKGDYVEIRGTGESGRIVGPGSKPGYWMVQLHAGGEREVEEASLEPVY
jgi:hypothetical protein